MPSEQGTRVDPTPTVKGISFTSALVRDYRDDMSEYDGFRTAITVPAGTEEVGLWAEEPIAITIRGEQHTIDARNGVVVAPNVQGKVVVTIEASDVAMPALLLRTNAMLPTERFYVFPDADAHRKLSALDASALHDNRKELGISQEYTQADCENVALALKNLSDAVQQTYDPSLGGLGRYETVVPTDDRAGWEVDVSRDEPTYRRLDSAEAQAAIDNAKRIGGTLAQGKKKKGLGKTLGKAGKSVSKTASSAGKTVSKTADSAGKTVSKTASSAGKTVDSAVDSAGKVVGSATKATKKAVHGAVLALEDITDDMAKIDGLAKDAAKQMGKIIREGTGKTIALAVKIGKQTIHFAIDSAKHIGAAMASIVAELGTSIVKLVNWLADLLGWDDIIHTQRVLRDSFNQALDYVAGSTKEAKAELKALIGKVDGIINSNIDAAIEKYGGGVPRNKGRKSPIPSAVTDKVDWLLDHLGGGGGGGKDDDAEDVGTKGDDGESQSIGDMINEFVKTVTGDPELEEALQGALDQLVRIIEKPAQAPDLLIGIVLNLLKAMLNLALSLIEGVVTLALDLFEKLIGLLRKVLNAKIKIPFLTKLFKMVTKGEPLTLLNFFTLLIAIPVNLLGKAAGVTPFADTGAVAQSKADKEWKETLAIRDWGYVYSTCQFLGMIVVTDGFLADEQQKPWVPYLGVVLGLMSQIAGFPTGYPSVVGWSWKGSGKLAGYIWFYQWYMFMAGSAFSLDPDAKTDPILKDLYTMFGFIVEVVHLGMFIGLVAVAKQDDRIDTCCILDPLPGIVGLVGIKALEPYQLGPALALPTVTTKLAYATLYFSATTDHFQSAKKDKQAAADDDES